MFKYGVANKVTFLNRGDSSARICSSQKVADSSVLPFGESFSMHKVLFF